MFSRSGNILKFFLIIVLSSLCVTTASAHFKLNLNVRILHVEHLADGLNVYMRLPMPYLVAHLLGEIDENGLPAPAPYTGNRLEQGKLVHTVDVAQLRQSTDGLALLARQGIDLSIDGKNLKASIARIKIYRNGSQPDFATLDDARQAFEEKQSFDEFEQGIYVGDTTVDVQLRYTTEGAVYQYALSSNLNPGLPDQDETANLILDYSPSGVQVFRARGLLHEPVVVTRSVLDAVLTFIKEGVVHILEGLDHVLFVICLVLGAMRLKPLLWRVTGFTIGHSITLSIGFFGFVPAAAWFVPAVETGIALSIIYVAVVAVVPRFQQKKGEWAVMGVTGLIGLLHGLGFSFVLQNILQVTSPNIWQSLVAFNIGVELGQLLIVICAWFVFYLIGLLGARAAKINRYLVASVCAFTALYWVIERG
ncbi:MAG: HupE/UreJ family protein, partial [Gammaproteobacteria bacterium]|nr:HupE/UreJ family protein [Gammaproteobacteria bacterium]